MESAKQHHKNWFIRHGLLLFVVLVAVLAGILFIRSQIQEFSYARKINFQAYTPVWFPPGVEVTGHNVAVIHDSRLKTTDVTLNFNLNRAPQSSFYEERATPTTSTCAGYTDNDRCESLTTSQGQHYLLITATLPNNTEHQTVDIIKGNTHIALAFQGYDGQPYSPETINHVVDSFTPVHYRRLPGSTATQCECGG